METKVDLNSIYAPSEDVVARDVHGEFVIIPITSGIGESDDEIFSLNNFGKAIRDKLDGKRSLKEVVSALVSEFEGPQTEIESDCLGLMEELLKRKMIVKVLKGISMDIEIKANLNTIYLPSENLVVKEVQGELLIIPLRTGIVGLESEFFKISETGKAMWDRLGGNKTLKEIAQELSLEYDAPLEVIEKDFCIWQMSF